MFPRKLTATLATIAASALLLGACSSTDSSSSSSSDSANSAAEAPAGEGGELTIGLDRELQTLDVTNGLMTQQPILILSNALYEPLMTTGDGGTVVPDMAESLESDDAVSWTLKLPSDLTFSDGSPLTSQSVIDHVERLSDPNSGSSSAGQAAQIESMNAPDDVTVEFTLVAPNADFPSLFARGLGMITSTETTDEFGFPIGAGPFKVEDFTPSDSVVVVPNENYWGEAPILDRITYNMLPDSDSRFQSLMAGDVDIIWTEVTSQFQQARGDDNYAVYTAPAATTAITLNQNEEKFPDLEVRKALAQAIDRDAINEAVNLGEGVTVDNPYALLDDMAPSDVGYPEYDQEAARSVLEGLNLSFALTTENRPDTIQRSQAIAAMLGEVGVEVTVEPVESANFSSALVDGSYEAADLVTSIFSDPSRAPLLFSTDGAYNAFGYSNPAVDEGIATAAGQTDRTERAKTLQTISEDIAADVPVLWLTASNAGIIASSDVVGIPDISSRTLISLNPATFGLKAE